jgi:hypothetical protein
VQEGNVASTLDCEHEHGKFEIDSEGEEDTAEEEGIGEDAVMGTMVRTQAVWLPQSSTPEHFPFGQRGPSSTRLVARTSYHCRQQPVMRMGAR